MGSISSQNFLQTLKRCRNSGISYFFLCVVFSLAVFVQASQSQIPRPAKVFLRPPDGIKFFTLGYNDVIAALLWIRAVQDLDVCENGRVTETDYVPPIKTAPSKLKGILGREVKPSKCHKGWVYSMMDVITNVQPRFKLAYESGAQFLAIAVDDREGARLIFEKGLKLYPNNWKLNFDAAYLYLWELKDAERASELLYQAMKNGGPGYLPSLVAGIYSEMGQAQFARHLLMDSLQKELHPGVRDRLLERLKEVDKVLKKVQ